MNSETYSGEIPASEVIAQLRKDKEAAEALVIEKDNALRSTLNWAECCYGRVTENRGDFKFAALEDARRSLALTPASMVSSVEDYKERMADLEREFCVEIENANARQAHTKNQWNEREHEWAQINGRLEARIADLVASVSSALSIAQEFHGSIPSLDKIAIEKILEAAVKGGAPSAVHPDTQGASH